MADESQPVSKKPSGPSIQERLKVVVERLQAAMIAMPRFRPADVSLSQDYDALQASILSSLVDLSAIAAVDRHATAVAIELAKQRKEFAMESQKLRDATDKAMQAQSDAIAQNFVPFKKAATA